jgi:integrase
MTTIAHLIAAAHVHRTVIGGDYGFTIARKALFRITEQAGALPTALPADGVLEAHTALRDGLDLKPKTFREEHNALRRLIDLPDACTLPADTALRIFQGEATLADALIAVDAQRDPERWKAHRSALVRFIAKVSPQTTGADVRANRKNVEAKLDALSHQDFGVARASFRTLKSQIRAACALGDLQKRQCVRASMLTGQWAEAVDAAKALRSKQSPTPQSTKKAIGGALSKVWPLLDYAWRAGIDADAVNDTTIAAMQVDLEVRQVANPLESARNAVYGWERLQALVPTWPRTELARVYQNAATASPHAIPYDQLPAELRAAWEAYDARVFAPAETDGLAQAKTQLTAMANQEAGSSKRFSRRFAPPQPAITDDAGGRSRKSGRANFRTIFLYAANAAIREFEMDPTQLNEIFVPDVLDCVLGERFHRQEQRAAARGATPPDEKNATLKATVTAFKAIAQDIGQSPSTIDEIDTFYDLVHPDFIGWGEKNEKSVRRYKRRCMGPSHKAMLTQFDGDNGERKLLAWFELPETLYERVRRKLQAVGGNPRKLSQRDFCDAITAAVAAITRSCPLRRENIGELRIAYAEEKRLGANLAIPNQPGKRGRIRLWGGEVKHGTDDVAVFLTPYATEIVRFYLQAIRPALAERLGADPLNPWLFPAYGMKHRALETITHHFGKRCWDAGIKMDLHANRHLTAKIVLDRDVTAMPLIQQILGHKNLSTTEAYYADIKQAMADIEFQQRLDAAEADLRADLLARVRKVS